MDKLAISFKTIELVLVLNLQAIEADGRTTMAELTQMGSEEQQDWFKTLIKLQIVFASRTHVKLKTVEEIGLDSIRTYQQAFQIDSNQFFNMV